MKRLSSGVLLSVLLVSQIALAGDPFRDEQGFGPQDHKERQANLLARIPDGVAIIGNAGSPDLRYLTGATNREAKLVLIPEKLEQRGGLRTTLFLPPKSLRWGVWDDAELSPGEEAQKATGISNTAPLGEFYAFVARLGEITSTLYISSRTLTGSPSNLEAETIDTLKKVLPAVGHKNLTPILDDIRWTKGPREIEIMRLACRITAEAFQEAARVTRPGLYEYEIDGLITYVFRSRGSEEPAFLIVGSGPNSCILHHMRNDRLMQAGELLLIDVGTVYHGMSTDLTRTIPVSGKFSLEQKTIYAIVLEAQKKAIAAVKPGATLAEVHKAAFEVIDRAGYGKHFIHGASHTLNGGSPYWPGGMPSFQRDESGQDRSRIYMAATNPLRPGCMFTVEPGIYIKDKALGIRIEDDILVTETGCEVLTRDAPREIAEIEKLMRERPRIVR